MTTSSPVINDGLAPELAMELLTKIFSAEEVTAHCYRSDNPLRIPSTPYLRRSIWFVYLPFGSKMIFGCRLAPWPSRSGDEDETPLGPQFWRYDEVEPDSDDMELELRDSLENALHDWATERFGAAPDFEVVLK